ncbi:ketoacyl-ACP synthase III [Asticcacaulis machinosus]|uniref:Ketoacyl-ACP synthase III n=1 Tax=Asticcacaulis machinosus TaxID=2984211 RepID=A0ABT5HL47_9CAUL|nr:ketoacyl-ACP synthase III [Asticcacaulis machinosus]MDC7676964.1 ketoacyl-ACP synthase III [Asticcacaulis machinosus]
MVTFVTRGPALRGIVTAMPQRQDANRDLATLFGEEAVDKIIRATGIETRPVSDGLLISDMAVAAAENLMEGLGWTSDSIDLLVVVTQTPDYPLPATSYVVHGRLGLPMTTATLDLRLGCSGFVYGLSVISSMMAAGGLKRALLIGGDVINTMIAEDDRALRLLFGDAVAATALEASDDDHQIGFDLGADGSGVPHLISETGGVAKSGNPQLYMDGARVLSFSLRQVAPSVARALAVTGQTASDMDHVILHQANAMMIQSLAKKIGLRDDQVVEAVRDYGNTGPASIPLAMCDLFRGRASQYPVNLLLSGFGVGWSWASAVWRTSLPTYCEIIRLPHKDQV